MKSYRERMAEPGGDPSTAPHESTPASPDASRALESQLGPSERILWRGRPKQGIRLRPADALLIPFSLIWASFALFWEYSVVTSGAPLFFMLWGIPFVLAGLYLTVGRFFIDSYQRAHTLYAVTNERVLLVGGLATSAVQSLSLAGLHDVSLTEGRDGFGSITFGSARGPYVLLRGAAWPGAGRSLAPAFDLVRDARQVLQLIREAQNAQAASAANAPRDLAAAP